MSDEAFPEESVVEDSFSDMIAENRSRSVRLAGLALAALVGILLGGILSWVSVFGPWRQASQAQARNIPTLAPQQRVTAPGTPTAVGPVDVAAETQPQEPTPVPDRRVTILLMGTDNRPGEPVGRTDTIMLVTVNLDTGSAGMVSLARDLLVPLPGTKEMTKINTAHLYGETRKYPGGGPALLQDTIYSFLGYPIDYWVRLNFDGFRRVIDQIDGIDIDVPEPINDPTYPDDNYGYDPLYIPAGRVHMNGALALKYARTRHVDSDYGRARRQQQVVMAIKDKLMQPGQLATLLPRLPGLAITLAKSVQTNMPIDQAVGLAREINQLDLKSPTSVVVDDAMGTDATDATWGFVLIPDLTRVRAAVARVFNDQTADAVGAGSSGVRP